MLASLMAVMAQATQTDAQYNNNNFISSNNNNNSSHQRHESQTAPVAATATTTTAAAAIERFARKAAVAATAKMLPTITTTATAATAAAAAAATHNASNIAIDSNNNNNIDFELLNRVSSAGDEFLNLSNISDSSSSNIVGSSGGSNLAATITSIRTNVTRVLYMYFQNVTDEFGYGAATTEKPEATTTSTTTTAAAISAAATILPDIATATTSHVDAGLLESTASRLQTHLTNATQMALHALATTTATATAAATSSTTTTTAAAAAAAASATATVAASLPLNATMTTAPSAITYPSYGLAIRSYENCSALFANYEQPQQGIFCNWTWDQFLCWPPTPAGVLARMHCPPGWHGIDTRKFANRKCELDGHWGGRPNETYNPLGWTDYQPCFKPEVNELMQQMKNLDPFLDIAKRTRTLEIVGLILSLFALILSLIIFCNFRSLRNNRTKIHKNLFIAMVLQVIVRLTLYLDQAFRRGSQEAARNNSASGIENTPYLCEASYVLLEYARTAMFMWMFIEGLYLHNMVTVAVFQGRFPHTVFSLLGWGMPVLMTTVWALCTAAYTDSVHDCWWNYNLTPYYWILEGPRLIVILLNFFFLMNIIRVLVVKLRQSQASDIEQTRKAVRAAIVLLPLLGITNLLHLVPALNEPWQFALWSYVTHFLTSFQGFFIAMIYCFLNGEVRTVLLKSLSVYMSVRGHPEWVPKRASMFSGAYNNTAPETEGQAAQLEAKRNESPPNKRINGRKPSNTATSAHNNLNPRTHITTRLSNSGAASGADRASRRQSQNYRHSSSGAVGGGGGGGADGSSSNNNHSIGGGGGHSSRSSHSGGGDWMLTLCFRGQKNKCVMSSKKMPPQIFMTTKTNALA